MVISLTGPAVVDLIQPLLPAGLITVGYEVSVKHKGSVLSGAKVTAKSKLLEAAGCKLLFEVCVMEGEKVSGEELRRRTMIKVAG